MLQVPQLEKVSTFTMIIRLYIHIVLILSGPCLIRVLAIACYECNQFPNESKSPCPGKKTVNYGLMYDVSFLLSGPYTANIYSITSKLQENDGRCNKNNLLFASSTPANSRFFLLELHEIAGKYRNLLLLLPLNYKNTIRSVQNASVTTSKIFEVYF